MRRIDGFSIIELMVALVVGSIFVIIVTQAYGAQLTMSSGAAAYHKADLLAYNNLRSYAYGRPPVWFECVYSGGQPNEMVLIDSYDNVEGIPSPVHQRVVASAPYGCGGGTTTLGYPIKVTSTVSYGASGRVLTHATYASY